MPVSPDAVVDLSTARIQLLLSAEPGKVPEMHSALPAVAKALAAALVDGVRVCALTEIPQDPFPPGNPGGRPMDAVLDLHGAADVLTVEAARAAVVEAVGALRETTDARRSGVVVGWPQAVIPGPLGALRYQYLMRRKPGLERSDYLDHYFHRHSAFAFHLNAIHAYTQVHSDPVASAELAALVGFGVDDIDSVTELSFDTVDGFFAGVTPESSEAGEDELRFVDRDRSVSFCSFDQVIRSGSDA